MDKQCTDGFVSAEGNEYPLPNPGGDPKAGKRASGIRIWALRIGLAIFAPIFLLIITEAALRIAGQRVPTSFLIGVPGGSGWTSNPRFGWQFFPPSMARTPLPFRMLEPKPEGVFRMVVLGESAAFGTPDPAFSFGRILAAMTRLRLPQLRVEVVNAALVAINSHAMLPIARSFANSDVDLFVIYAGHNEVVGPFGAGTVFGPFHENLGAIRAGIWLRTTGLGQGLSKLLGVFRSDVSQGTSWKGMEFFIGNQVPADDPRLRVVYEHFERNLADIFGAIEDSGAAAIVCTTACNLRDCPPFASQHRSGLSDREKTRMGDLISRAESLESEGQKKEAAQFLQSAVSLDREFAEAHYRLARAIAATGDSENARVHFQQSRDLDCLRFRADGRMNEIVRRVARARGSAASLVDVESRLGELAAGSSAPGDEYFYEHVHFRFEGNYRVARLLWPEVVRRIPPSLRGVQEVPEPPSLSECAAALAWTDWDQYRMLEEIIAIMDRPPFTNQLGHKGRMAALRVELKRLESARSPEQLERSAQAYRSALNATPDDLTLRRGFGGLLFAAGRYSDAVDVWQSVLRAVPGDVDAAFRLGCIYSSMGREAEAAEQFARVIAIEGAGQTELAAKAHFNWGNLLRRQNRLEEAIEHYRASLDCRPDYVPTINNLGSVYLLMEKWDEAIEYFRRALQHEPSRASARQNLAYALNRKGLVPEAAREYRELLKRWPDHMEAKRQLEMLESVRPTTAPQLP